MSEPTARLQDFLQAQVLQPPSAATTERLGPYLAFFRDHYLDQLAAVIFYGSCLSEVTRSPTSTPDFFVVTTGGDVPAHSRLTRMLHPLLPPASQTARLPGGAFFKYVYLDLGQLDELCSEAMKDLFVAGRLSKRVALVHAREPQIAERICRSIATALMALAPIACALLPQTFTLEDCIKAGWGSPTRASIGSRS